MKIQRKRVLFLATITLTIVGGITAIIVQHWYSLQALSGASQAVRTVTVLKEGAVGKERAISVTKALATALCAALRTRAM